MNRKRQILKYADLAKPGIEVAPYFNPTVRKADGYPVLIMDVFSTEELRAFAAKDSFIPDERLAEIETVDIVGDASSIAERVAGTPHEGAVHWIISSHNFEHLPNPIKFLQGCAQILAPGGVLSMAIPDGRSCFDHFRFPTRLSDWLDAYHEDRRRPTPATLFDGDVNRANYFRGEDSFPGSTLDEDPAGYRLERDLRGAYGRYVAERADPGPYRDAHCSVFLPQSFELLIRDLHFLGLCPLEFVEGAENATHEFFVHLRKPAEPQPVDEAAFYARRDALQVEIAENLGRAPYAARAQARAAAAASPVLSAAPPVLLPETRAPDRPIKARVKAVRQKIERESRKAMRRVLGPAAFEKLLARHRDLRRKLDGR